MSGIERLVADARAGFARGLKPVRCLWHHLDTNGTVCGCAVTAAYVANYWDGEEPLALSNIPYGGRLCEFVEREYRLSRNEVVDFLSGFDGSRSPRIGWTVAYAAGHMLATEVFQEDSLASQ